MIDHLPDSLQLTFTSHIHMGAKPSTLSPEELSELQEATGCALVSFSALLPISLYHALPLLEVAYSWAVGLRACRHVKLHNALIELGLFTSAARSAVQHKAKHAEAAQKQCTTGMYLIVGSAWWPGREAKVVQPRSLLLRFSPVVDTAMRVCCNVVDQASLLG